MISQGGNKTCMGLETRKRVAIYTQYSLSADGFAACLCILAIVMFTLFWKGGAIPPFIPWVSLCRLYDNGKMADEAGKTQVVGFFSLTRHLYKELGKEILMAAVYECIVIKCCYRMYCYFPIYTSSSSCLCSSEQSPHLFLTSPFLEV